MASFSTTKIVQASAGSKISTSIPSTAVLAPSKLDIGLRQDSVVLARSDSFDAARPRIDSTGLGRPRIDSSVDLGNKLDPPTPDSSSGRNNRRQRLKSNFELDSDQESASSADTDQRTEHASASVSGLLVAEPPTRRVEQHKPYRQPAPMLRPTRPLPHQRKRLASGTNKRVAGNELHTKAEHGASAAKKLKTNAKQSLAMAYGKPATVVLGVGGKLSEEDAKLPDSAADVTLRHFTGTWRLDTEKSETLYAYLKAMGVSDLAIEAAMKAEAEGDTLHIIDVHGGPDAKFTITRRSRMSDKTMSFPLGIETTIKQNSGRQHRTTVSLMMQGGARIVERTIIKEQHTFTVTRTLVGDPPNGMNCTQVLRTPSQAVVTRRWFNRADPVVPECDGSDFLKELDDHYQENVQSLREVMYEDEH